MRIFYLFYLKQDDVIIAENDEKKPIIVQREKPLSPPSLTNLRNGTAKLPLPTALVKTNGAVKPLTSMRVDSQNSSYVRISASNNKQKKKSSKPPAIPYQDWENVVEKVSIPWSQFVTLPSAVPRNKQYIRTSTLSSLNQCPSPARSTASNASSAKVCYDVSVPLIVLSRTPSPNMHSSVAFCLSFVQLWGDAVVTSWRARKVKDLCEEGANSKVCPIICTYVSMHTYRLLVLHLSVVQIHCYDSLGKSRYCVFENVMVRAANHLSFASFTILCRCHCR